MTSGTFVLVHGGGSTARFWDRLLPHLDRPAVAVDLPGRGGAPGDPARTTVEDEVAAVLDGVAVAGVTGPIVLVAHSSGGLTVPGVVAALGGRVAHIVLNAALVPTEGGCGLDCLQPRHRDGLALAFEDVDRTGTPIVTPGPPDDIEALRRAYGGDPLDDETLAYVADPVRFVPDGVHHHRQPVRWSAAAAVPVTYVVNERDRPIPVALQEEMVARLPRPAEVVRLDTGHLPAVTAPAAFAAVLNAAVV